MSKPDSNQFISVITTLFANGYLLGFGTILTVFGLFLTLKSPPVPQTQAALERGEDKSVADEQLILLGDTFSGYSTFRNTEFQQALRQEGVELHYANEFNQAQRTELLNSGEADLLVTSLDQFLTQQPQGKIVGLIDRTVGADAVVLNNKKYPQLNSLLDLNKLVHQELKRNQSLGITFAGDTPSEYLALVLSTKFEAFNFSDFQVDEVADAADAWKRLQDPNQNTAVAVLWEPFVTQARMQGYKVVLSSQDTPETIVDVIVASNRLLQSQPEKVSAFLTAYYKQIDPHLLDASRLRSQIASDGKLSNADAATVLQGIKFFTAIEARNWLTSGTLDKQISSTAAVLALAGKIEQVPPNPSDLYISQSINQAANNTQQLIDLARNSNPELAARLAGKTTAKQRQVRNSIAAAPNIGNLQLRGEVKFDFNSKGLSAKSQQTLNSLAKEISQFNSQTVAVRVIGHTSATGEPAFNQQLSTERAQVVAEYLRDRGLQHKVVAEGKGSTQLLPGMMKSDPRNQYTEIRLVRLNSSL